MEITVYTIFCFIVFVPVRNCLYLGPTAGDLSSTKNTLIIKKASHHSPPANNIQAETTNLPQIHSQILYQRLSDKPSFKNKMKFKRSVLNHKVLKIPKLRRIPKLPLLPLLPILPPFIPKLPLLPLPLLPIVPSLPLLPPILPSVPKLLKPLRIPIISNDRLHKTLGSELKPLIPGNNITQRKNIKQKLLNLKKRGILSSAQVTRLKKVLL